MAPNDEEKRLDADSSTFIPWVGWLSNVSNRALRNPAEEVFIADVVGKEICNRWSE